MPADDRREPHTLPEPPRAAEPDTAPGAGGPATPPGADTAPSPGPAAAGPRARGSTAVGSELAAFMGRLDALADTGPEDEGPRPPSGAFPAIPGYDLVEEIARGGMGVVYAARDRNLGREVAVKTILPHLAWDARYTAQFEREARLTALLTHPGVPPAHALGTLPDGRPFLAMKLIRGRTLAAELAGADRAAALPRLLGVFEQVCQTVGYAHSVGVIHRDLKPGNVMVGAFGEVQVMDWGLARHVRGADADGPAAAGGVSGETVSGSAKGTPAYMPPEQARGEWDRVDARADVFALGGILCATLTGHPPYAGDTVTEVLRGAVDGDVGGAVTRLDGCGADAELVGLCKQCLAPDPADRPGDGKAVAEAVAAYRAGVEQRARRAETERAAAEAEAREQRKRRKVQLALAAAVGLLLAGVGGFAWWQQKQEADRRERQARAEGELSEERARAEGERNLIRAVAQGKADNTRAGVRDSLAQAEVLRRQARFGEAQALLTTALGLARSDAPELAPEVERGHAALAFARELDDIRYERWAWLPEPGGGGRFNDAAPAPAYLRAFAARGLDFARGPAGELARRVGESVIRDELVDALDDWAVSEPDGGIRTRILDTLRAVDPGGWLDRLRDPAVRSHGWKLAALATEVRDGVASPRPAALIALAELMNRRRLSCTHTLEVAFARNPADFQTAFMLGLKTYRADLTRSTGYFRVARAIRPSHYPTLVNLGGALKLAREADAARDVFGEALRLKPDSAQAHYNLGTVTRMLGRTDEAIALFRKAIQLDRGFAMAHSNLGNALREKREFAAAVAACQEAVRLAPDDHRVHTNLGVALRARGKTREAVAAYDKAILLEPRDPAAHANRGGALQALNAWDEAIAAYEEAVRLAPNDAATHVKLGVCLRTRGRIPEAIAAYTKALAIDPSDTTTHYNLGVAYLLSNDLDRAAKSFRDAIHLRRDYALPYGNLAVIYNETKRYPEAVAAARQAIHLNPTNPNPYASLGVALRETGDIPGARAAFTDAARLDSKQYGSLLEQLPPPPVAPPPREVRP